MGGGEIVSQNKKLNIFTKEEQLLLHLSNFKEDQIDYFAPESITQDGIQKILKCNKSLVCRIIKKNESIGFIYRKKMKIENNKRKLDVFFLTENGKNFVLKMINSFKSKNRQ